MCNDGSSVLRFCISYFCYVAQYAPDLRLLATLCHSSGVATTIVMSFVSRGLFRNSDKPCYEARRLEGGRRSVN
jgi:hypothetical protein